MSPQAPRGDEASADAKVQVAMRILEDALVKYRSNTEKGKAILKMITAGARTFGRGEDHAQQILPAELKSALLDNSAPPGAPPPAPPGGGGAAPPGPGGPSAPGMPG